METLKRQEALPRRRGKWSARSLLWAIPLALLLFVVVSDLFGWAYLRKPVAAYLSSQMGRKVEIDPPFSIHLRPSIPIRVGAVRIAAPEWSKQPHFADVEGIEAEVNWGVLVGRQPLLHRLAVARADIRAERDAQGRASWSMGGPDKPEQASSQPVLPVIERLSIGEANIDVKDAMNDLDVQLQAKAGDSGAGSAAGSGSAAPGSPAPPAGAAGLLVTGSGKWKTEPVSLELRTKGSSPILEGGVLTDVDIKGKLSGTELAFNGSVTDVSQFQNIKGKVSANGPSLGQLTTIPGLTLPETPPYRLEGDLERSGSTIKVNVSRAEIGSSSMVANLEYDGAGATPMLRGTLNASRLVLQDLGPSIGTTGGASADKGAGGGADKKKGDGDRKDAQSKTGAAKAKSGQKQKQAQSAKPRGASRVLPDKEFDLPSLRAMNADVAIDLQKLDLGTEALKPLTSLKSRLLLEGGVLKLQDLKSDLAGGTVTGSTVLDGSSPDGAPVFDAQLKWHRVDLKSWVAVSADYFVAGRFSGETLLKGKGKSTASILESLNGSVKGHIDGGSISHQLVELAGLDAAQALGVFFSGDKALKLSCALVDLRAEKGSLRSNLFLLNTPDTIFFVEGGVNFRDERLDLRLVQSPKDWSPLSLRSPVTIRGTLGDPAIGVEPMPIALKLLGSAVLASVTPLAALLPLIEFEDNNTREGCGPAINQIKQKASELAPGSAAAGNGSSPGTNGSAPAVSGDDGTPPVRSKDAKATPTRPGRTPGERP